MLANQATQNASTAVASLNDQSDLDFDGGSFGATDEATQAAAQAGSAASNSAARFTSVSITGPTLDIDNNIVDTSSDGALQGVYAANTALNLAPQIAANINTATNITTDNLSATAVGVLANQSISIGLDGAALSSSLTGNYAPTSARAPAPAPAPAPVRAPTKPRPSGGGSSRLPPLFRAHAGRRIPSRCADCRHAPSAQSRRPSCERVRAAGWARA